MYENCTLSDAKAFDSKRKCGRDGRMLKNIMKNVLPENMSSSFLACNS